MMKSEYLQRSECPICGDSASNSTLAIKSNPTAESQPFGTHGKFLSGYTSRRIFFSYYRCRGCTGLFCKLYYTQEQLDSLYAHQPENLVDVPQTSREATSRAYVKLLKEHCSMSGRYLELGPDIGLFAGLCAQEGSFSRYHLYEPNQEVHEALARRMPSGRIEISPGPYAAGVLPPSSINLAVAIHVLDHLIDPAGVLRAFHRDLANGGTLLLATHDEGSLLARLLGRRWPPYTLQHPQLFTGKTISRLLERCGFRNIRVHKSLNYFPISVLMRASLNILGIERTPRLLNVPWQVGLRLGNIATIATR